MPGGVNETGKPFEPAPTRAKLFKHGGSQAVRLPKAFRFEGSEVSIRRAGDAVILEPIRPKRRPMTEAEIEAFWAKLDSLGNSNFPDRDQPPMQERDLDW
jgi:antitoxin VapB